MDSRRILTLAGCVISATAPLTGCGGGDGATDSGGTRDAPALDAPQGDAWQDLDAARRASVWSCLPLFDFPAPEGPTHTFTIELTELDGFDVSVPSVGTRVTACPLGDQDCGTPLSDDTTDASGYATLTVPAPGVPWRGFLRFQSATSVPTQLFLLPPVWRDDVWWSGPWAVPDREDLVAIAGAEALDDTRGHALVLTADCCYLEGGAGTPAECRRSDTNELEVTIDGIPPENTGIDDYGVWINLEPGPALVEARLRTTHELVGQEEIFIVAGGLSQTVIGPTPQRPTGFECVGAVTWPDAPAASLEATFRSFENPAAPIGDGRPFEGLEVTVCAAGSDCASPLDTGVTDATGAVTLTLPTPGPGFTGYLRATAAGHLPTRMTFSPPIATSDSRWLQATHHKSVLSASDLEAYVGSGFTYDPTRATLIATTTDCTGLFSAAVDVALDGAPAPGHGGDTVWVDVTPGTVHLVATLHATGEIIAEIDAEAVAGEITAVHFGPMP